MKVKDVLTPDQLRHFRTPSHPVNYLERAGHLGLIPKAKAAERIKHYQKRHSTKASRAYQKDAEGKRLREKFLQ